MVVPNSLTNCGFFVYSYSPPVLLCLEGTNHSKYGVTKVNRKNEAKYPSYLHD